MIWEPIRLAAPEGYIMKCTLAAFWLVSLYIAATARGDEVVQRRTTKSPPLIGGSSSVDRNVDSGRARESVEKILQAVRDHSFHPVRNGFTFDAELNKQGVADLNNVDWRVRLLAVRDLIRLGTPTVDLLIGELPDKNENVRQICAMTLGLLHAKGSRPALEAVLQHDKDTVVRSSAAISLGELSDRGSLTLLRDRSKSDSSRDVRHQCEIATYRIEHRTAETDDIAHAFAALDDSSFRQLEVGRPAIDFELFDTRGRKWRLGDGKGKSIVLIWIFADWCPVCHGEFHELIELRDQFARHNVELVTIECHDLFRARVMVGDELSPQYWFSKKSPQNGYRNTIWWRHLSDPAGAVGAKYGVDPMAFVVHSEWINRPATIIVDPEGIVRFAYYGTYWRDRPSIGQTLDMISTGRYEFRHPKRLELLKE